MSLSRNRHVVGDHELRQWRERFVQESFDLGELCREAIDGAWHSKHGFDTPEAYLEDRTGVSYGTLRKVIRVLEALNAQPPDRRDSAKEALGKIGRTKASIIAPAISRDPEGLADWVEKAEAEPADQLQARVSKALGHRPRGPVVSEEPGAGWYRRLLALPGWPEDVKADTERAFKLAETALEKPSPNPLECWAAIVHEFVATYEPKSYAQTVGSNNVVISAGPTE